MTAKRAWKNYPDDYRRAEIETLADWIRAGESGSIIGLPGAGKSNLLGYLSHRPETLTRHLPPDFRLALVWVDLNNLPGQDLATLFRVILRSLYEGRARLSAVDEQLPGPVEALYRKVEDKTDPFLTQSALREALLLFQKKSIRLVLVLDPFDPFCRTAPTSMLDNLRGLRDSFKATLSYLMGLRHPVTYLRSPEELGELYEIVDMHQCWVGAMTEEDALWVITQVEDSLGLDFSMDQSARLIDLTGGYPALLRAAALWLAQTEEPPPPEQWLETLLDLASIQNRLEDMRHGLTGEEEAALSVLQRARQIKSTRTRRESLRQISQKYEETFERLARKRLCRPAELGWQIFSPLFARFVAGMEGVSAGKIWHETKTDRFFLGERELSGLSDRDRQLLQHFLENPRAAHSIDELIEAAWPEADSGGVSNEAVQQAIRHLRKQIEPNPANPSYLTTERGVGYRFFPEGAPKG